MPSFGNREVRRRCVGKSLSVVQHALLINLLGVSFHAQHLITEGVNSLGACAAAFELRHRPAGEASLRTKCELSSQRHFVLTIEVLQKSSKDRRCHETRNVLVPGTFWEVGSRAAGPSPAIRRCFGVRLLCSACATS